MEIVFWIIGGLFLYVIVGLGGWLLKGIGVYGKSIPCLWKINYRLIQAAKNLSYGS